jgi:hypothetical protein
VASAASSTDGRDRRLVAGQDHVEGIGVDGVAAARAGHRDLRSGLGRRGPRRQRSGAVQHDLDVKLERVGVEADRGEGADGRPRPVSLEELVAVPVRQHDSPG